MGKRVFYCWADNARVHAIMRSGFAEEDEVSAGFSGADDEPQDFGGVRLSDKPLDMSEGTLGGTVLAVSIAVADSVALERYAVVVDYTGFREWFVPSALLNALATVKVVDRGPSPPKWTRQRPCDDEPDDIRGLEIEC